MNIIENATRLAVKWHEGQKRKGDNLPYIIHPFRVAQMLTKYGYSDEIIAAGLAHDFLEDTKITKDELKNELGENVLEIVKALTNDDSLKWEDKKLKYIESVKNGPDGAKAVAAVDKIHNLESLLDAYEKDGSDIWERFNRGRDEKIWFEEKMLAMLRENWSHPMLEKYAKLIEKEKELK